MWRAGGIERLPPEALAGANPLVALLRSLLPWVAAGRQPDYAADEAARRDAGGGGGEEGEQGG